MVSAAKALSVATVCAALTLSLDKHCPSDGLLDSFSQNILVPSRGNSLIFYYLLAAVPTEEAYFLDKLDTTIFKDVNVFPVYLSKWAITLFDFISFRIRP